MQNLVICLHFTLPDFKLVSQMLKTSTTEQFVNSLSEEVFTAKKGFKKYKINNPPKISRSPCIYTAQTGPPKAKPFNAEAFRIWQWRERTSKGFTKWVRRREFWRRQTKSIWNQMSKSPQHAGTPVCSGCAGDHLDDWSHVSLFLYWENGKMMLIFLSSTVCKSLF